MLQNYTKIQVYSGHNRSNFKLISQFLHTHTFSYFFQATYVRAAYKSKPSKYMSDPMNPTAPSLSAPTSCRISNGSSTEHRVFCSAKQRRTHLVAGPTSANSAYKTLIFLSTANLYRLLIKEKWPDRSQNYRGPLIRPRGLIRVYAYTASPDLRKSR